MIDIIPLAGMLFSLLLTLIVGGFVLLFPLARRLGQLLELRMEERRQAVADGPVPDGQLEALRDAVEALQKEVGTLSERQQFVEGLLERPEREALPAASPATAAAVDAGTGGAER